MSRSKRLLPNEPLIYERANNVVYARYQNRPDIERWIVGGDPGSIKYNNSGDLIDYSEWLNLCEIANDNVTLQKLMDKLVTTYYVIKDSK